jgi:hypothetical protein
MRVELFWQRQQYRADVPMNLFIVRRIAGSPDLAALRDSLDALMQRHEALRTRLALMDGVPVQLIQPRGAPLLETVDLSALPVAERDQRQAALTSEFIQQPLDLVSGPTFRIFIITGVGADFLLGLVLHHYFGDARSMEIITTELLTLYAATINGNSPSLAPVPAQYVDYALWQRNLATRRGPEYIDNLRAQLSAVAAPPALPAGHVADTGDSGSNGGACFEIDAALAAALARMAQASNTSAFPALLAAHQMALAQWTGQMDAVTAVPFAARTRQEFSNTVGYLINAMPIPSVHGNSADVQGRIRQIRRSIVNALLWQDVSYELLEPCVCAHPPLCRTMFNYIPMRILGGTQNVDGLSVTDYLPPTLPGLLADREQVRVMPDFVFYLRDLPNRLACDLLYNNARYTRDDMAAYSVCFTSALAAIVNQAASS